MRHLPLALIPVALALFGCAGSAPTAPIGAPGPTRAPEEFPAPALVSGEETLVGAYEVQIDLESTGATVTPVAHRGGQNQPPQALTYDLDIDRFLTSGGFRIAGLETDLDGDLDITFTHSHPFPAPDFAAPITATNRADLGYTGRLVVYANSSTSTIFTTATLDPEFVLDPAGYVRFGTLLANPTGANNTFPYVLLADEALDNRVGVSNGANPLGNYDVLTAGWNRTNAGPSGDGWTGFDYIHGGQTITNHLRLSTAAVAAGDGNFRVAVLIKYTDPRGQGGRTMRFPPEPPIAVGFAYRLPFAALDGSTIEPPDEFAIQGDLGGSGRLDVFVRDWDASAAEAADPNLSDESDVTLVPPGTSGAGELWLDFPQVLGDPVSIGLEGSASGRPGNELHFGADLTTAVVSNSGPYVAGLQYVDPENGSADDTYHFGVDPFTLAADAGRALEVTTYQVLRARIYRDAPSILGVDVVGDVSRAEVTFTATLAGSPPDTWLWEFNGGVVTDPDTSPSPLTTTLGFPGSHTGRLTISNPDGSDSFDFPYESNPQFIGLDIKLVHAGATYPFLWPGLASWAEADLIDFLATTLNQIYVGSGFQFDPALMRVIEVNNPQVFDIDSEADFNLMWELVLNHNEEQPQFMIINADNWAGFGGIMSDTDCNRDNAGRGCVVTSGSDAAYQIKINAHELGHVFALPHTRTDFELTELNFNLMGYWTDDVSLREEVHREAQTSCALWEPADHNQYGVSNWWVDTYILN